MQRGLALREKLFSQKCSFVARVTADYGDKIFTFRIGCTADTDGAISFAVIAPESIAGIMGGMKADSGYLTFEDTVLAFPLLADGELSPISAPWLLISTLRRGNMASAGMDGDELLLTIHDSYEEDALRLDIWLDAEDNPLRCDIVWQNRRILSVEIEDFAFV